MNPHDPRILASVMGRAMLGYMGRQIAPENADASVATAISAPEKPQPSLTGPCAHCGADRRLSRPGLYCSARCRYLAWEARNRPEEYARWMAGKAA